MPFLPEPLWLRLIYPWEIIKKHEDDGDDDDDDKYIAFLLNIFTKFLKAQSHRLKPKFVKL